MSWRTVVISNNAKLDYQIGYMVVRGEKTTKIHLNEIGMLIVESTAVSMTSYLLSELMKIRLKSFFVMKKEILVVSWFHIMEVMIQAQR